MIASENIVIEYHESNLWKWCHFLDRDSPLIHLVMYRYKTYYLNFFAVEN